MVTEEEAQRAYSDEVIIPTLNNVMKIIDFANLSGMAEVELLVAAGALYLALLRELPVPGGTEPGARIAEHVSHHLVAAMKLDGRGSTPESGAPPQS